MQDFVKVASVLKIFSKNNKKNIKELIKQQYREQELLNKQEAMLASGTEPFENRLNVIH